jgi:hypothetical protein
MRYSTTKLRYSTTWLRYSALMFRFQTCPECTNAVRDLHNAFLEDMQGLGKHATHTTCRMRPTREKEELIIPGLAQKAVREVVAAALAPRRAIASIGTESTARPPE